VKDSRHLDPEPDLLLVVIRLVRSQVPALTEEQVQAIEAQARAEVGGLRARIPKRRKHLTEEQRAAIAREALNNTDSSDQELASRNKISRRSLIRYVKRGFGNG
jgi:hypothetical protein